MVPNPAKRHAKGKVLSNPLKGEIKRHKCKERIGRQSHNHASVQPSQWIWNEYNKHVCHRTCDTDFSLANSCQEAIGKSEYACSKVNENAASVGTLRHALHLHFLCPFPKKNSRSIRRCKSDPLSQKTNFDAEGEQRFYLYNNMRVVFPQRHFHADKGKMDELVHEAKLHRTIWHLLHFWKDYIFLLEVYGKYLDRL